VTLRPNRFNRRVVPIICLALAGVFLLEGYQIVAQQGLGDPWIAGVGGVAAIAFSVAALIAVAVLAPKLYIRVDDATITFGPPLTSFAAGRNTYDRREVALIRCSIWPPHKALFLRSDGSILCTAAGDFWGRDGLQTLANYLGVPFES
jgi:hypothetical protein